MSMLKLLTIALTTTLVLGCEKLDTADECMQGLLLLGDPSFKFPTDNHELDVHCGAIAAKEKCVREYSVKCFDTFSRQVTNNLITSSVKTNKHYCISPKHRQTFIRLATCANSRKDHQDQIMKAFISTVHAINSIEQKNLKLPLLCCNFKRFKTAILDTTTKEAEPKCSERDTEETEHMIDSFSSDVLNLLCPQDYSPESGEKCDTILEMTPTITSDVRYRSLMMPLVNIFDSLKS